VVALSRLRADEVIFNPVVDERWHLETIVSEDLPVLRDLAVGDRPLDPRVSGQSQ
jgi:hypothetical protein